MSAALALPTFGAAPTSVSDRLGTLRNVTALAELGFRPQLIKRITSAQRPEIMAIVERVGGITKDPGGRQPHSVANLIESLDRHIASSLFLRHYISMLHLWEAGKTVLHQDAFLRAVYVYRSEVGESEARKEIFTPDHMFLVANLFHEDKVTLCRCGVCQSQYLTSSVAQVVGQHVTTGDCPVCRELMSIHKGRPISRLPDPKEQKRIVRELIS